MTILDKILTTKRHEIAKLSKAKPISTLEKSPLFSSAKISMKDSILAKEKSGIIAEFKRQSPSKGIINNLAQVNTVTQGYVKAGVSGLSVLTDHSYFGGSNTDLLTAREIANIPILRKDFTISEYQIIEAKAIGANAILLIAAALSKEDIKKFTNLAQSINLEVLLEIHTKEELDKYIPEINMVGINNRNLKTFEVDYENAISLAESLPKNTVKIAESGIRTPENIKHLQAHDFNGFLIGETFMKHKSPETACKKFINSLK